MKRRNRRQSLLEGFSAVGAWAVAPDLVRRLTAATSENAAQLVEDVRAPREILYAWDQGYGGYRFSLCQPGKDYYHVTLTWREWFEKQGVDPLCEKQRVEWAIETKRIEPGEAFPCPELDESVPDDIIVWYPEWDWPLNDCPEARAFDYLQSIDLAPDSPGKSTPLGQLYFEQGTSPGLNDTQACADSEKTVIGVHNRLLELGERVELRFGTYY